MLFIKANFDVPLYHVVVAVVLLSVYASRFTTLTRTFRFREIWCLHRSKRDTPPSFKAAISAFELASRKSEVVVEKESGFSTGWWTDDQIFQLERRAIFSKTWIYATHRNRFSKPGDYLTLNVVGFSFFLILGKDHILRGFHNVCRHRAYEVTRKECGSSTILGCRYHGWSYDTKGQLTKAPEFDKVPGFDREANGLWEIRTKISAQGLVFVHLEASETESQKWDGRNPEIMGWNMNESERVAEWKQEAAFNWKLAATENAIEVDDSGSKSIPFRKPWATRLFPWIFQQPAESQIQVSLTTKIYLYPVQASWLSVKALPHSPTKTTMHYELYVLPKIKPQHQALLIQTIKETHQTHLSHLETTQSHLTDTTLLPTSLAHATPHRPIHRLLAAHYRLERHEGREIFPAARQTRTALSKEGREDEELCKEVERRSVAGAEVGRALELSTGDVEGLEGLDW